MWPLSAVLEGQLDGLSHTEAERVQTIARWCQSYVLKGDPRLGRSGAVCPWCPPSVTRGCFYLTHAQARFGDDRAVVDDLCRARDQYLRLAPDAGPDVSFKTLIYVMSITGEAVDAEAMGAWMLRVHRAAKPGFLSRGLMLGEFFPGHTSTGLRSDSFRPLQAPSPLFVIRSMVPLDIAFLSNAVDYAAAYFATFGEESLVHLREVLSISPERLAPSKLRSVLECIWWFRLQHACVNGRDVLTGVLPKYIGYSRLQQVLQTDRNDRPPVTVMVFQPHGLGHEVTPDSPEHVQWLWDVARRIRRATHAPDFIFRDGGSLVAILLSTSAADIQRMAVNTESTVGCGESMVTAYGVSTESVLSAPTAAKNIVEWEDGALGMSLLRSAYEDLRQRDELSELRPHLPVREVQAERGRTYQGSTAV